MVHQLPPGAADPAAPTPRGAGAYPVQHCRRLAALLVLVQLNAQPLAGELVGAPSRAPDRCLRRFSSSAGRGLQARTSGRRHQARWEMGEARLSGAGPVRHAINALTAGAVRCVPMKAYTGVARFRSTAG